MATVLGTMLLSLTITACVTEHTYSGTDIPVKQRTFDKEAAARERIRLGLTYLRRGNSEQAKYNLDKAKSYAADLEDVHLALAYYYQKVGDVSRSALAYQDAIDTPTPSGDAMNNFGVFLCRQQQYNRAEQMFLAAVNHPDYTRIASSYENLGICSKEAGNKEKARSYFEMALKYEPHRAVSLLELTQMSLKSGNFFQARTELARYHDAAAESALSLAFGIKIELGLKNTAAAERFGALLLKNFPDSEQAKQYRASLN